MPETKDLFKSMDDNTSQLDEARIYVRLNTPELAKKMRQLENPKLLLNQLLLKHVRDVINEIVAQAKIEHLADRVDSLTILKQDFIAFTAAITQLNTLLQTVIANQQFLGSQINQIQDHLTQQEADSWVKEYSFGR